MTSKPFTHAAVVGTGIAGLLAARVLSDFFERVTVLEKDTAPSGPGFRRYTPQGRHFHGLIPGGMRVIQELLPGVADDLRRAGSLLPESHQIYYYRPEGKSYRQTRYVPEPPNDNGERLMYVQTRGLLEYTIRSHVEALPNVIVRYQAGAQDVVAREGRLTGVTLSAEPRDCIETELIVDASGRTSKTLQWLHQLGFERPDEEVIHCDFAYTTVFMRPKDPSSFSDVCFLVLPDPKAQHASRGGGLMRIEGGLWMVAAGGRYGDFPPQDLEGFTSFLATLPHPQLHQLVRGAELVGEPSHLRFPKGVRRRFDKLQAFPDGLVPIGDAIAHYNPAYGQGMAAACRQAKALQSALRSAAKTRRLSGFWQHYLPEAFQETRAPWLFAALADFQDSRCSGDFPMEDLHLTRGLQYLAAEAARGDGDAALTLDALGTLSIRLDALEASPWRERIEGGIAAG